MYKRYEEEEKKKQQQLQQQDSQPNTTANATQSPATPKSTAQQYKPSNTVQTAQQNLATHTANKPTQYQSNWASQLDGLMSQIVNREKFSYDMNADALYQQAKDMYTNQANMGMQNAMAQASALTGGYGSSYGQMVGQQAYAQQMQGLNNMLPELYQNALNQYINEGNELYNRYNMVANQENLDYGRYRDSMNDYLAERDYLNSIYNTEAERDYNRYLDERNYTYQTDRDAIADSRYEQEWAASEEQRLHDNAYQDKVFEYTQEQDKQAQENWQAQFGASEDQRKIENERYDKALEDSKPTTTYEGEGVFNGEEVPKQLSGVPGLTTVNPKFFDENGNFKSATLAYEDVDGTGAMIWNIGGKEVKLQKGVNPYTNNTNKDVKNGAFANGYQPDNVGGNALAETDMYDYINGVKTPVYQTDDGKQWIWDDSANEYLEYGEGEPTTGSKPTETPTVTEPTTTPPQETVPEETPEEEYPQEWYDDIDNTWEEKTNTAAVAGTTTNPAPAPTTSNTTNQEAYDKMLSMGWTDATNSPYSQAQRDKLISEGKMIAIEVNGEIKYLMR